MSKTYNGPRSNFSLLPFETQYRMITLVQDGATFAALAQDPEIAQAYKQRGLRLVPQAVSRLKKTPQYREWTLRRARELADTQKDRLTTAILRDTATLDTVAEQTRVALLKAVSDLSDLSDLSDEARVKALRSLTASVSDLSNGDLRRKLAARDHEIDELSREREAAEREWRAREAELLAEIETLKAAKTGEKPGLSKETLEQVEEQIGLL